MRGATLAAALAAIGRVSRAGCADWASEGSDAARSGQEGYSRLGMLSDRCCGAALGHPPESGRDCDSCGASSASRDNTGWI